ncbi:Zn-ribbon domain-containing OB-fold protein [Bordetella sp. BOR01]|uniref:Zn-ribbon domain-containing OB-fold protein n=1 Tax=Bordetella sp. BOR01 TaxID=2854779 RepID=UPI001C470833|nr:Zn-ribbon domain-containing OB-fold protein [Bordetella sp. BOR01]MBV7482211.1 Zn-ribbon domain-containing OB-fold protein [Bordetella sp. BOR01]
MGEYLKPLPVLNKDNRPFWEGCKDGKLRMQQCGDCGHIRFPINSACPKCLSGKFDWKDLSGRGTVFSYVVFHQVYNKAFAEDVPYNVALVQLEEGPRMYSNVVGVPNDAVRVGDRLEVVFDSVTDDVTIPRFRLSGK